MEERMQSFGYWTLPATRMVTSRGRAFITTHFYRISCSVQSSTFDVVVLRAPIS
jgi:hypothetical protein